MSPSKVSEVKWDEFFNIVDGQKRTGKEQHHGISTFLSLRPRIDAVSSRQLQVPY